MANAWQAGETKVLDHGYVKFIESWGSDERIIEAARMSTAKGFQGWGPHEEPCPRCGMTAAQKKDEAVREGRARNKPCDSSQDGEPCDLRKVPGDEKLLAFLWKNQHATPFEMAGVIIEVQAPIFVFREWHRHRTQSYNEMSARYTPLPDVNYVPSVDRALLNSKTNKQAGTVAGADELTSEVAERLLEKERSILAMLEDFYQEKLRAGFPKELARTHLNFSRYSRMRASANLRNWLAFLTLRDHHAAQWEIRQYARTVHELLSSLFPRTLALFDEGKNA